MIERYRDLILIYEGDTAFVISSDSSGAIGNKENDVLKVDEETVAKAAIRVALAESISIGAKPIVVSDTLAVEMEPSGRKILQALKNELRLNGFPHVVFTGSSEENFPTSMTGVGITIVSKAKVKDLKIKGIKKGMYLSLLGLPLLGGEVLSSTGGLLIKDYLQISKSKNIIEAIPVGSRGIAYEIGQIEKISGLELIKDIAPPIDIYKSGGPSTSCLVIHNHKDLGILREKIKKPIHYMGILE